MNLVYFCGSSMSVSSDLYCLTSMLLEHGYNFNSSGFTGFVFGLFQFPGFVLAFLTGYSRIVGSHFCWSLTMNKGLFALHSTFHRLRISFPTPLAPRRGRNLLGTVETCHLFSCLEPRLSLSSPMSSCSLCHVLMSCFLLRMVDLTIADIKLSYVGRVCLVQFSVLFVLVDATLVCWFIGQRLWSQPGRPCRSVAGVTFAKPFCLQVLNGLSI